MVVQGDGTLLLVICLIFLIISQLYFPRTKIQEGPERQWPPQTFSVIAAVYLLFFCYFTEYQTNTVMCSYLYLIHFLHAISLESSPPAPSTSVKIKVGWLMLFFVYQFSRA